MHFAAVFHIKTLPVWADRATERSLASKPMRGDKMRVFSRLCARFQGWSPTFFFARKRFLEDCATTFSANRVGICTHIAGQLAYIEGTRCAKKIHCPPHGRGGRRGRSSVLLFWGIFFVQRGCVFLFRWPATQQNEPAVRPIFWGDF